MKLLDNLLSEYAPAKITPTCPDFGVCGGCSLLDISYDDELKLKREMVLRLLKESVEKSDVKESDIDIIPSPNQSGYRNKMEFSFGDHGKDSGLSLGIRKKKRYYEVVVPLHCELIPEEFKNIVEYTLDYFNCLGTETFYHRMRRSGTLRYLVVRRGEFTGELLINLVTTEQLARNLAEKWAEGLLGLTLSGSFNGGSKSGPVSKIVGILHTTSNSLSDAVVPEGVNILWGRDHFQEKICGLTFGISPFSFFQTNSAGAERLYDTVAEFVGLKEGVNAEVNSEVNQEINSEVNSKINSEVNPRVNSKVNSNVKTIYDLYCGTGTIAQVLAPCAKEVIGIELVPEAVAAAIENARANNINNCRFIAGDVLKSLQDMTDLRGCQQGPDVLVLDPPRDGIHKKAIDKLVKLGAKKVVYVSCKPTSLARDLPAFEEAGYHLTAIRLHDMFPRTPHVETVVLLCRGDT